MMGDGWTILCSPTMVFTYSARITLMCMSCKCNFSFDGMQALPKQK